MSMVLSMRAWLGKPQTNEDLMLQYAASGENKWLSRLYDQTSQSLYHYLLVLSDPDTAADVVQKTFVKVIEKRHLFTSTGRFDAWLFTMARRTLIDEFRRSSKYQLSDQRDLDSWVPAHNDSDLVDKTKIADAFVNAMQALPFLQREAFSLQQEGFGLQEIAQLCDTPVETIKTRLRYAKTKLKESLESHHA